VHLSVPAADFLKRVEVRLQQLQPRKRIVFPEGDDPRVIQAASRMAANNLLEPVLVSHVANPPADGLRRMNPDIDPATAGYAAYYLKRRAHRGATAREAQAVARRPLDFAALMVAAGDADGFLGGAANSTAVTVRAALHAIGAQKGVKTVSSFFVLCTPNEQAGCRGLFIAADCAVVIDPTANELADIALMAAGSAHMAFECEPVVGLLPASDPERTEQAARILRARAPRLDVRTGDDSVYRANAIVFPDLNSANIVYKMVEWLGGASAFGPMLQGMNKPANDLSRAATPDDIYVTGMITALQAHAEVGS
jgi:phosphate acetyltransferase